MNVMPAYAHTCLVLLVPSCLLIFGAIYLDVRRGHAAFLKLAASRDNVKGANRV